MLKFHGSPPAFFPFYHVSVYCKQKLIRKLHRKFHIQLHPSFFSFLDGYYLLFYALVFLHLNAYNQKKATIILRKIIPGGLS